MLRIVRRLPSHVVNGLSVALGLGLLQVLFGLSLGALPAQIASMGAICASLAHRSDAPATTGRRVVAAALLAAAAALVTLRVQGHVVLAGLCIALVVFAVRMSMAWGARAGYVSFAPILAVIFTLALSGAGASWTASGWVVLGGLAYAAWAFATAKVLEGHSRVLAVAEATEEMASLLRLRAERLRAMPGPGEAGEDETLAWGWVGEEAKLAELLHAARDLVFPSVTTAEDRRLAAVLLSVVEQRDVLLASHLDLALLGRDEVARELRVQLAEKLDAIAEATGGVARTLRGRDVPAGATLSASFERLDLAPADPRARLLGLLATRVTHLVNEVARMRAALAEAPETLPLTTAELASFVSDDTWPLAAVAAELSLASPVLRHAVRSALALGGVYLLAYALPWAPHPYWLVLTVAVVLRETLDQTLARRNARVLGTAAGCVVVLGLVTLASDAALRVAYPVAAGAAHAFVTVRYVLTAMSATVMALVQAHLVAPQDGVPIVERLSDTVLGALVAWAFCYVWPSWERRTLPAAVTRATEALRAYALLSLETKPDATAPARRGRQAAYEALSAVVAAVGRTAVEPASVRPPTQDLLAFVQRGHSLMAHLSSVRLLLVRRRVPAEAPEVAPAVVAARAAFEEALAAEAPASPHVPAEAPELPAESPADQPIPWLLRRLYVASLDAALAGEAGRAALAKLP